MPLLTYLVVQQQALRGFASLLRRRRGAGGDLFADVTTNLKK